MLEFLTGESDDMNDLESLGLLNTKIENLQKLKFDDQKWEIEATNFVIHYSRQIILFSKTNQKLSNKAIYNCF